MQVTHRCQCISPGCSTYILRQGGNIVGSEQNVGLELADVVPSVERECESVANEGSENEKKSGRG